MDKTTTTKKSRYSYEDRKQIAQVIENLKNDADYIAIFEILLEENSKYTENSNGVFLNFSTVSDNSLDRISKYLRKINKKKCDEIDIDMVIVPQSNSLKQNRTHKLSNYEQNIIRQRNIKKVLNEESDYEEMKLDSKQAKKKVIPKKSAKTVNPSTKKKVDTTRKPSSTKSTTRKTSSSRTSKSEY